MAKLKLSQAELAALDALIAEMQGDHKGIEAEVGDVKAFITAVGRVVVQATKVTVKATPYVTDIVEVATARSWVLLMISFIPRFIRNYGYTLIARRRYSWFGQMDSCMVPTQEIRDKFLT